MGAGKDSTGVLEDPAIERRKEEERPSSHSSQKERRVTAKEKRRAKKERERLEKGGERDEDTPDDAPPEGEDAGPERTPSEVDNDIDDDLRESYAFRDLRLSHMTKLQDLEKPEEVARFLSQRFELPDYDTNLRTSCLVDFFVYNIMFAREQRFSLEQASAMFSIFKVIHEQATTRSWTSREALQQFKKLVVQHSIPAKGELGCHLFSLEQVKEIASYASRTYFGHYSLYQHVFSTEQEVNLVLSEISLETPAQPPAHSTGITMEQYEEKLEQERLEKLEREAERRRLAEEERKRLEDERLRLLQEEQHQRELQARKAVEEKVAMAIGDVLLDAKTELQSIVDDQTAALKDQVQATLQSNDTPPVRGSRTASPAVK